MGEKWRNPPIFYTVAQLRFNQILNMERYVPEIQDLFRLRGFPVFSQEADAHFEVDIGTRQLRTQNTARWSFSDNKRTQAYVLTKESIAFHTTSYQDFEQFSGQVLAGLKDVHEVVKLDSVVRVGLRLLDAVTTTEALSVEAALDPKLFGAFFDLGGSVQHSYLETVQELKNRLLISKVFIVAKGLPLPPDLVPLPLNLPKHLRGLQGKTATLDNDCSSAEVIELSSGLEQALIAGNLRALKDSLNDAFKCATTEFAREVWK